MMSTTSVSRYDRRYMIHASVSNQYTGLHQHTGRRKTGIPGTWYHETLCNVVLVSDHMSCSTVVLVDRRPGIHTGVRDWGTQS